MSAYLHNRVRKLEQAMTAGKYPEDQQDPKLVSFLAKFDIPAEQCPFGISAGEYIGEVLNLRLRLIAGRNVRDLRQVDADRPILGGRNELVDYQARSNHIAGLGCLDNSLHDGIQFAFHGCQCNHGCPVSHSLGPALRVA